MGTEPRPWSLSRVLGLDLEYDPRISYCFQQCGVPPIKQLRLTNRGTEDLDDIQIAIAFDPPVARPLELHLSRLEACGEHSFANASPPLSPDLLRESREREAGLLQIRATSDGWEPLDLERPIEILGREEWSGGRAVPELLAAFVLPNAAGTARLLSLAKPRLEAHTESVSFDGYQSRDRQKVMAMVASVYEAVADLGATYAEPPASFETDGQKIRLPDRIVSERLATCLDISLLQAAALEQAGLRSLLVLVQGHAFAGCWLDNRGFFEPTIDDPVLLRKRHDLDELVVFDGTGALFGSSFTDAIKSARARLDKPDSFRFAVDVRTARAAQIRPLPLSESPTDGDEAPEAQADSDRGPIPHVRSEEEEERASTLRTRRGNRLERWKSKLLDLSLRNRMLNFRPTKRVIELEVPDLAVFEDGLAAGRKFEIWPQLELRTGADGRQLDRTSVADQAVIAQRLVEQIGKGCAHSTLTKTETDRRMTELRRMAKTAVEESGSNEVFLVLGLLRWFESESSETPRLAPLLLLPVGIERRGLGEPQRLYLAEEEAQLNVTLLEKIERDFGLDTSPVREAEPDDSGVDVAGYLDRVRRLVLKVPRWEVVEQVQLGRFSFKKHLMWRDLEARSGDLLESDVVQHLLEGAAEPFPEAAPFAEPEQLDKRPAGEDLCVVDADSSQLAAVQAVRDGTSFVLQGPPGTGKSQTITNLVAQALGEGRTVLFVSEKMAALNVVHERLERVGLGPFCLEAHSDKSSKRAILEQLRDSLYLGSGPSAYGWKRTTGQLEELRSSLNRHARRIHIPGPFGESIFGATAQAAALQHAPSLRLGIATPTVAGLDRLVLVTAELARIASEVRPSEHHPWAVAAVQSFSPALQRDVGDVLTRMEGAATALEAAATAVGTRLGVSVAGPAQAVKLAETAKLLVDFTKVPAILLDRGASENAEVRIAAAGDYCRERTHLWTQLSGRWNEHLLSLPNFEGLRARWAAWGNAFFLLAFFFLFTARRVVASASALTRLPNNPTIASDLQTADRVRSLDAQVDSIDSEAAGLLGGRWRGLQTDWDEVGAVIGWARQYRGSVATLAGAGAAADNMLAAPTVAAEGLQSTESRRELAALIEASDAWTEVVGTWIGLVLDSSPRWFDEVGFDPLQAKTALRRQRLRELRDWCAWNRSAAEARALGLAVAVDSVLDGTLKAEDALDAVDRAIREDWLEREFAADEDLAQFRGLDHDDRIRRFRSLDSEVLELAREQVVGRLRGRIPDPRSKGEVAALVRELKKKKRHKAVRRLFGEIGGILGRLKPCVLMSPLSVARFLDPAVSRFDLVVFDEASQIPPWDAIGAIARGRQVVVVGDSKQLPPTSFFDVAEAEEDFDEEDIEDFESILDECVAGGLPAHALRWHYRSRHEHLIAFSNHHYYANHLLTFPAANESVPWLGVKWRPVPAGHYDKGRSRTNRAEADAVVKEIVTRLLDPARRSASLGVVTFSQAQQRLVEDLLDVERARRPEIEPYFTKAVHEPVFVKNLENVQGDERDVMLFSICYGPDRTGRVSMNFGPLNRKGGERRLNVAITRARQLLLVFSTLRADQIDLVRTRAVGVAHLRMFLDYANRGPRAIDEATGTGTEADFDSPFERVVHERLTARGLVLRTQVGCSGYRIDLAVVDPDRPGSFVLGIECDGATYHSARSARDRDRIRQSVLEDLGWTLHRIWSTDWWQDPDREIERALDAVDKAKRKRDSSRSAGPPAGGANEGSPVGGDDGDPRAPEPEPRPAETSAPRPLPLGAVPMPAAPALEPRLRGDFDKWQALDEIASRFATVVEVLGPIHFEEAARLVAGSWGVKRLTKGIRRQVMQALPRGQTAPTWHRRDQWFWPISTTPDSWRGFRLPTTDAFDRVLHLTPPEELANTATWVLKGAVAMNEEELMRESVRLLGGQKLGSRLRDAMEPALALLEQRGTARREGERISFVEPQVGDD